MCGGLSLAILIRGYQSASLLLLGNDKRLQTCFVWYELQLAPTERAERRLSRLNNGSSSMARSVECKERIGKSIAENIGEVPVVALFTVS